MGFPDFILAFGVTVIIPLAFFYMIYRLVTDRRKAKRIPDDLSNRLKELEQSNQYLEKRVRTLEAIVTEEDFSVKDSETQISSTQSSDTGASQTKGGKQKLQNTLRTRS